MLHERNSLNSQQAKYLFKIRYGTFVPSNTRLRFKFAGKRMKVQGNPGAGDYQGVRLPSSLSSLSYEVARSTTNVGLSVSA